ncbi:hypothetical protein Q0Y04_25595 [Clostridioides difficile]|uniref:hypothetical protein n=1 Tax=Clostridioides difficile TaxID=1496 RepID=UPI001F24556F|nr:hypothetical protein [Clostridioides difficile]WKK93027.1 hypothetical protein Q0Y04_25595 [Clostridioides difficile]
MKNKKIMLVLSILSISIFAVGCTNAQNGSDSSKKKLRAIQMLSNQKKKTILKKRFLITKLNLLQKKKLKLNQLLFTLLM